MPADKDPNSGAAPRWRVPPSIPVALGVFFAYVILVNGVQIASGVPYSEFFATIGNAWKSANASLAAGAALLLGFAAWSRWDRLWRDAGRLPMTKLMWVAPIVFAAVLTIRLSTKLLYGVPFGLIVAIVVAGVGVGFAEEMLFRGVVLRSLRTNGRAEAWAMLISCVWFGMMHATNVLLGSVVWVVALQVCMASLSGVTLYLFRRATGSIVAGMVAHGLWDISTFLPSPKSAGFIMFEATALVISAMVAIIGGIAVFVHDRRTTMGPAGPVPISAVADS